MSNVCVLIEVGIIREREWAMLKSVGDICDRYRIK